ncbi:MAG: DUF3262 family protein [Gammaproteobacteria bacterium]|nr:DUF3262 family protein [Gammaproteobacteria bacterium]MCP5135395.1 DUF3262 family protein [Gammaproteobacteria bacterium]
MSDPVAAFEAVAGVPVSTLGNAISALLLTVVGVWVASTIKGLYALFADQRLEPIEFKGAFLRALFLLFTASAIVYSV